MAISTSLAVWARRAFCAWATFVCLGVCGGVSAADLQATMLPELDKDSRTPEPRRSRCHMEGVDNFHEQWKGVEILARVEFWVMPDGRTRHPHLNSIVPVEAKDLYESWVRSNALRARYTPTAADSGPVRCSFVEVEASGTDISSTHGLGHAIDLTRRAADAGDVAAQASYGLMNIGPGRSYTQANPAEWFLTAAHAGDPVGSANLDALCSMVWDVMRTSTRRC